MHHFQYKDDVLHCEAVDLRSIARETGTPVYVYSAATMRDSYRRLEVSLAGLDHRICFALKSNSNVAVARLFDSLGAGFDVVSGGEILRVAAAGASLRRSVFAGVGKTEEEIELALTAGIYSFHVESEPELERINAVAGRMGQKAPIALRINPDVDAKTHAKITTGKSDNKFGIPLSNGLSVYEHASRLEHLHIKGVGVHIGSQITTVEPFVDAVKKMTDFVRLLKERFEIEYFDIGGGLGIVYENALASGRAEWWAEDPVGTRMLTPEAYGKALVPLLRDLGVKILLEPGRYLTGNAGVLLTRVEYVKPGTGGKTFLIVDAAMNDLLRPAMYDAYHEIVPLEIHAGAEMMEADIVGPVCETGDTFDRNRRLPRAGTGDVLAILSAGAYGHVMAGRYNTRPIVSEVLVDGNRWAVVRTRETVEDILAAESVPDFLKEEKRGKRR